MLRKYNFYAQDEGIALNLIDETMTYCESLRYEKRRYSKTQFFELPDVEQHPRINPFNLIYRIKRVRTDYGDRTYDFQNYSRVRLYVINFYAFFYLIYFLCFMEKSQNKVET